LKEIKPVTPRFLPAHKPRVYGFENGFSGTRVLGLHSLVENRGFSRAISRHFSVWCLFQPATSLARYFYGDFDVFVTNCNLFLLFQDFTVIMLSIRDIYICNLTLNNRNSKF